MIDNCKTGFISQNATAVFSMFRYDYKLQLVKTADAFRPGMPYTAYLKVAHQVCDFA